MAHAASRSFLGDAETRAREYVMAYAWVVETLPVARHWPPERIGELDIPGQALARRALREGIAALFLAWPKQEGCDDDPVEWRSLGSPIDGGDTQ